MNPKIVAICLILLPFSVQSSREAAAAEVALPPTLAKALEGAELDTRDGWAFRQTVTVQALDEPGTTAITRWDPSRPAGERCTVVSVTTADGKETDEEDPCQDGHERETYGDLASMLRDTTVQTVAEDDQRAVYSFVPTGDDHGIHMRGLHIDVDEEDAERMVGTLEVVKTGPGAPYVERFSLKLKEPAGNLLARLKKLDIVYAFAPDLESGAKLLRGLDIDLNLSIFTMFNVTTDISMRFDEYRKL
jgi:hypothetical protein